MEGSLFVIRYSCIRISVNRKQPCLDTIPLAQYLLDNRLRHNMSIVGFPRIGTGDGLKNH